MSVWSEASWYKVQNAQLPFIVRCAVMKYHWHEERRTEGEEEEGWNEERWEEERRGKEVRKEEKRMRETVKCQERKDRRGEWGNEERDRKERRKKDNHLVRKTWISDITARTVTHCSKAGLIRGPQCTHVQFTFARLSRDFCMTSVWFA